MRFCNAETAKNAKNGTKRLKISLIKAAWKLGTMFCPECGIEERQANQFCRACGTDLRSVRFAVETPDGITASAMSARDEIGRAVAAKIRETHDAHELKTVAEDVLPEIEKFLESPAEKRLRRMRTGTIISTVGLGVSLAFAMVALASGEKEFLTFAGMGFVTFMIGLGFILNGTFLTVPKTTVPNRSLDADTQRKLDAIAADMQLRESPIQFSSVTEHTTKHLNER
jgi:hypothetical protein